MTAAALLLCVAMAALWVRSYRTWDSLVVAWPAHGVGAASAHGQIILNIRLTSNVSDLPRNGLSSTWPSVLSYDDGQPLIIRPDPLGVWQQFQVLPSSEFEWQDVTSEPPVRLERDSEGHLVMSAPAGPRPIVGNRYLRIRFPHWLVVLLLGIAGVHGLLFSICRWVVRKRCRAYDRCENCGYDIRATPKRCPECGTAAARATPSGKAG